MNVALITARGGSKGLPRKNIYPLNGKPLIAWSIEAAKISAMFDDIYVSTDCNEIAATAVEYGAKIINRPAELAADTASSHVVIQHAIRELNLHNFDRIMLLQPTSPMRTHNDISEAFIIFDKIDSCHCVISVFEPEHHPAKAYKLLASGEIVGLISAETPYLTRQELPQCFQPNGAIYLFSVKDFNLKNCIPKFGVYPYLMEKNRSIDIDTIEDINEIERLT